MEQYLSNYDKSVKELKKQGIVLPEVVLAMQLLDCAKLPTKDIQIVLTAVDYTKKGEMYNQIKRALRKFLGEQGFSMNQDSSSQSNKNLCFWLKLKWKHLHQKRCV